MTIVYIMRHSESFQPIIISSNDSLQIQNEKWVLTKNGEELAKKRSELDEFKNLDVVYSSNYVRAICTAKYFTNENIYIDSAFGERRFGIQSWNEMPKDFAKMQFADMNYKIGDGESLNEVLSRQEQALERILKEHNGKRILIVGHSTALATLLSKWCEVIYQHPYKYKGNIIFKNEDGKWKHCETFKLTFDNEELISIENIK